MERNRSVKSFIASAKGYLKCPNDTTTAVLQRDLGILTAPQDVSIFTSGTPIATDFYETLHTLISTLTPMNPLLWSTLDVLHTLSSFPASLASLMHIYKFPQLLSPFLSTSLIPEKRMKLLKLLKRLTKGIKIHWQESHLPALIQTLTQWINPSQDTELITNSLSLLINLCRKNPPAIYTLVDSVNSKNFHRNLLRLQTNTSKIQILCCKILLIMEETNYELPEQFILNFLEITFKIIEETLEANKLKLLNETVDFFEEVRCHERTKSSLITYEDYTKNLKKIMEKLEGKSPESVEIISKFFTSILKLKVSGICQFHPQLTKVAINSLKKFRISINGLSLLKTVIIDSRRNKNSEVPSDPHLDFVVSLMTSEGVLGDDLLVIEVIQLIQELAKISNYRMSISQNVPEPRIREMMRKIREEDPKRIIKNVSTPLYVNLLCLISDLATSDSKWLTLYTELIQNKKIQMIIAVSIFRGDFETKSKTLSLISSVGFNQECILGVTKCLTELEKIFLIEKPLEMSSFDPKIEGFEKSKKLSPQDLERLERILEKYEEKIEKNDMENVFMTEMMELYETKINGMRNTEENLGRSLISAERNATFLQHKISQMNSELTKLHELLFSSQKNVEIVQGENCNLHERLSGAEKESKKVHEIQKMEIQGLRKIVAEKSKTIEEFSEVKRELEVALERIEGYVKKLKDLEGEKVGLKKENQELMEKNKDLGKSIGRLQERVAKRDQRIQERERENEALQEAMGALKQESAQLMRQCKSYETAITEKEETIKKLETELTDLSRMRDMIYSLTAQKKDSAQNETT
ncbi:GRIP and coiled-coil domain-containing protein 2 [Diachasma alloeum]|uniref:GRIP and coiled-coil domain-containing protein 2 n=1 Tax=Diachasma alloeum TaxID=454923 RepID=UPI0007383EBD|nr:GRIP and coiled-coil domain-containing protein 2 [Diachasma alloeum]XP_015120519.1 GRIP and coiled-coil domain-containing protein 2 [Diachasma alloeum]